ncbi:ribonuclease T(2) [Allostella vacuolata]|nr:ribonuclease T(2) [Stella vacuolata]
MTLLARAAAGLLLSLAASAVAAEVRMEGQLLARQACPAVQSIRTGANPGAVAIEAGRTYPLLARNQETATHYRIEVEGAVPRQRWVAVHCGAPAGPVGRAARGDRPSYVLAVSWQPAFCEGKPEKPECRTQTAGRFDADHFTLHGLWPQPRSRAYCRVPPDQVAADERGDWDRLPAMTLAAETRRRLERAMPGAMSHLDRHEWIKHGTCYEDRSEEAYFRHSLVLLDQLNAAAPRQLFRSRIGAEVTGAEVRAAFDAAFGPGAGDRVRIACRRDGQRNLVVELTLGLAGRIADDSSLAGLMAAAAPTAPGCPGGVVDPVGLQ